MLGFLALTALSLVFGPWIFILVLFGRTRALRAEIAALRPDRRPSPIASKPAPPQPERPKQPEPHRDPAETAPPTPPRAPALPIPATRPGPPEPAAPIIWTDVQGFEKSLASRWLIWLGALALSLAGLFLTAYAAEQGWLGPKTRISLGFVMGLALAVAGEWVRRRPFQRSIAAIRPDYVPLALSAAGISVMYASIYAGNALYGLYPPAVAFLLLAAIGLGAVMLALLQGWFVALVGLLASFVTPALVPSDSPSAWILFAYLLTVLGAGLAVVRYRSWWLLGYANLACVTAWGLIWLAAQYTSPDAAATAIYILAVFAAFQLVRQGYPSSNQPVGLKRDAQGQLPQDLIGWGGFLATALLLFVFGRVDNYGTLALAALAVFTLTTLWMARRNIAFDLAFVLATLLILSLFATWHFATITPTPSLATTGSTDFGDVPTQVLPPELAQYIVAAALFGAIIGAGGFIALWGAGRVAIFAGMSVLAPVLLFVIAYWRFLEFGQDLRWSVAALALALINALAVGVLEQRRTYDTDRIAGSLYAAVVFAFISLGMATAMKEAWLTVALALQLPALAWISGKLKVDLLRIVAGFIAAIVLVRLILNQNVIDYATDGGAIFNWVLYGYGIPALAFFAAARMFAKTAKDRLVTTLETGALIFAVLLVTFEIRLWTTGSVDARYDSLLEQSLQSIAWLSIGFWLMVRSERIRVATPPILAIGGQVLVLAAAVQVLVLQVAVNNPLDVGSGSVGSWPIFNILFLAYFIPACFAFALAPVLLARGKQDLATAAYVIGIFLLLVFVSLEVKHWFQGQTITWNFVSTAENYAISAAWLAYALALLASAIVFKKSMLRYGSLAILLITVGKVFVADMAGLTDLYRVASFLGLGLCLIGIGYIYQRFVFAETATVVQPSIQAE